MFEVLPLLVLLLLVVVLPLFLVFNGLQSKRNRVGPPGWPFVGHYFLLDSKHPHKTMAEWAKTYGSVYTLQIGLQNTVVLNDVDSIKEAFGGKLGDALSGRPYLPTELAYADGKHGIAPADGEVWRQNRRFTVQVLHQLAASSVLENRIHQEASLLLQELDVFCSSDEAFDPLQLLHMCSANIICPLLMGERFQINDSEIKDFEERQRHFMDTWIKSMPIQYFPFLRYLIPGGFGLEQVRKDYCYVRNVFLRKRVLKQMKILAEKGTNRSPENFVQAYLRELQKRNGNVKVEGFCDRELLVCLSDLYTASQETTTVTLGWSLLYMIHNPTVQANVQKEIDENVGDFPKWVDRVNLPYTMSCLTEIMRVRTIVPLAVYHSALSTVEFRGMTLDKGTTIIPNIWATHNDEKLFPEPSCFRPDRFIDRETGKLVGTENVIPFSVGKRVCPGENVARMVVFLLFTAILYRFSISSDEASGLPSLDIIPGLVERFHSYKLKLKKRI